MDIKKIGITGVIGFVSTAIIGVILTAVMYRVSGAAMGWCLDRFKS